MPDPGEERLMANTTRCPQCGADNAEDSRRCRVCANLLNASVPEAEAKPLGLPLSMQVQMDVAQREGQGGSGSFDPDGLAVEAPGEAAPKLSSAEIERLTRDAMREERMKKRPGFLKKLSKSDEEQPES